MKRVEQLLFLLFIALLPLFFPRDFRLPGLGPLIIWADVVFAATAIAWVISLARGRTRIRWSRFYVFAGLYYASLCLAAAVSINLRASLLRLPGEAYLVAIGVMTVNLVRSWADLRRVSVAWLVGTAATALVGVAGVLFFYGAGLRSQEANTALERFGSLPAGNYPRLRASFANANMLCTYMGVSLAMLLVSRALGWIRASWFLALGAASWFTALLSLSPGIGGLLLAQGLWTWNREGRDPRRRRLAGLVLAAGIAGAVAFLAATVIEPVGRGNGPALRVPIIDRTIEPSIRVLLWQRALNTFLAYPIAGQGLGTRLAPMTYVAASGEVQTLHDAHNMWLSVAGQAGIIGLAAFLSLVVYAWRCTARRSGDDERLATVKLGLRLAFVSLVLFQGLSGSFENTRHMWVLMGLIASVGEGL